MKLEPDLIRSILVWCEDNLPNEENAEVEFEESDFPKYSLAKINFHTKLLIEENYIIGNVVRFIDGHEKITLLHLTMNGYQYLNLLNSKAWKTAQRIMKDFGVIFVEGAIKAIIDKYIPENLP